MIKELMIYFENTQNKIEITYKLKSLVRLAVTATLAHEGYRNSAEISVTFTDDDGITTEVSGSYTRDASFS